MIEIYEGVIYRGNFKTSPFNKVIEKLFAVGQKYKDDGNVLMQGLVKLIMKNLFGVQTGKNIKESCCKNSQHWMETEYDDSVIDYWKLPKGSYIVNLKKDDGIEGDNDIKKTLPCHLCAAY